MEQERNRLTLDGVHFKTINECDNISLIVDFEVEEIKEAVWDYDGDKCLRLDGYNFTFVKTNWHILHEDFTKVVQEFH